MNMQLRVVHTTEFAYDGKAEASYNQARLTPVNTARQIVLHHRLEVSPSPWVFEYTDYFGSHVTSFEVLDPHDTMTVTASSTVQVDRPVATPPVLGWRDLASREVEDRWTEYLTLPAIVAPPSDFTQRVKQVAADHEHPSDAARDLCHLVHDEVEVVPGSTDVGGLAASAWQQRTGVGQDIVHLVVGGLRAMGLPARYVSGYFHPDAEPVVGLPVAGSPHAWVEWWDDGWQAFDPCTDDEPGDRYVSVARGRDHLDVRPISGIYSGAETSRMDVSVELTRLA